jgi:hypothetical protein
MSLSDSLWAALRLWIPAPRWGCPTQEGLPGSWTDLFPRAAPNHPGESGQVLALCFPAGVRLPPHGGSGHSLLANEAESDSLTLRLAGSPLRGFTGLDFSTRHSQDYMSKEQLHGGLLSFH